MSDAWKEIQELKSKQSNLRAKLAARRKEREGLVAEITKSATSPSVPSGKGQSSLPPTQDGNVTFFCWTVSLFIPIYGIRHRVKNLEQHN